MPAYALRKRRGHWSVFSGDENLLDFDSYDEAVETTRSALKVLEPSAPGSPQDGACGRPSPSVTTLRRKP